MFCVMIRRPPRSTHTDTLFPTRRSSDLIIFASVNASNLQVGDVFKNVHMKNRTWNAVYLGTAPSPHDPSKTMFKIRASRRGVKTAEYLIDRRAIFGMFKIDSVMAEA